MSGNNLKQQAIAGALWEGIHNGGAVFLAFISTIILARLLTPEDYGYIGMIAIFFAVAEILVNGGFGSALIQKKHPTDADFSTVFFFNIGISTLLYIILFFCAPAIANFFHTPLLAKVLRVQGLIIIIDALRLIQSTILRKRFQFKTIALVEVATGVVALALVVYLAWKGFGVWALVIWRLFISITTTVAYWVSSKWRPVMFFSKKSFKELFGFGVFMLLSGIVNQLYANMQGLLIGHRYTADTMGYYSKAQNAESLSSTFLSKVANNVSYPVMAEIQDNREAMIGVLRKMTKFLFFITLPMMMLLLLIAKPLFILLYSERWLASVPYFRILCFMGIFVCVEGVGDNSIAALGKGKTYFWQNFVKKIIGIAIITCGMFLYEMTGLLVAMVLASFFNYCVNVYLINKHVGYSIKMQMFDALPVIFLTAIPFTICWFVGMISGKINIYLVAVVQSLLFVSIYLLGAFLLKVDSLPIVKDMLFSILKKMKLIRNK